MKVMAVASYPVEAAATRFRVQQFIAPLAQRGIEVSLFSFFDAQAFAQFYRRGSWPSTVLSLIKATAGRLLDLWQARHAEVVFVQREAMVFGPPWFEWIVVKLMKRPMALDLDDATYVSYTSPTYGRLGRLLKWAGKTDDLIRWAEVVICGNNAIAEYVTRKGGRAEIIPTVVNPEIFRPVARPAGDSPVVLGWIGTHSTFPYLQTIFPVLSKLAAHHDIRVKVVGAAGDSIEIPGVKVECSPWRLDREVADFQSLDIGLYPIDESIYEGWASGKSGFKAIQYMAVGIPYIATPVGGSGEIGEPGVTHFTARTAAEWHSALEQLISNPELRRTMGAAGRRHVTANYSLAAQTEKLADTLRTVASR
jgi:glycosyltransferase involved in cell wall biosynthesis